MNGSSEVVRRAIVDHDLCAGVTECLRFAPAAFALDRNGLSVFAPSGNWSLDQLEQAADACPMGAIRIDADQIIDPPTSGSSA